MGVETFPVMTTRKDAVIAWGQKNSLWPMPFGTACCAIEFMGVVSSVFDLARFGAELVRFSPGSQTSSWSLVPLPSSKRLS